MRSAKDVITLQIPMLWPAAWRMFLHNEDVWRNEKTVQEILENKRVFSWPNPKTISAIRFEYPGVRTDNNGVVIYELRLMDELLSGAS